MREAKDRTFCCVEMMGTTIFHRLTDTIYIYIPTLLSTVLFRTGAHHLSCSPLLQIESGHLNRWMVRDVVEKGLRINQLTPSSASCVRCGEFRSIYVDVFSFCVCRRCVVNNSNISIRTRSQLIRFACLTDEI